MKRIKSTAVMAAAVAAIGVTAMLAGSAGTASAGPAMVLVGSGCAGYARQVPTGPGSVTGMAQDPVATEVH